MAMPTKIGTTAAVITGTLALALCTAPLAAATPYSDCLARKNTTVESCAYLKPKPSKGTFFDHFIHNGGRIILFIVITLVVAFLIGIVSEFIKDAAEDQRINAEVEAEMQAEAQQQEEALRQAMSAAQAQMQAQAPQAPPGPKGWRAVDEVLGEE